MTTRSLPSAQPTSPAHHEHPRPAEPPPDTSHTRHVRVPKGDYAWLMFKRPRAPKWIDGSLRCSFCGKAKSEVGKLIAGPGVYICNECVGLCGEIIEKEQRPAR